MQTVTAVALVAALGGLLAGGGLALVRPTHALAVQAFAGGLLLALVAADLLPDALRDGQESGVDAPVLIAVAGAALAAAIAAFGRSAAPDGGCCSAGTGRVAAIGLAVHGLVEGAVLGLGLGLISAGRPLLLAAFCLHKLGEGFALVATLRSGHNPRGRIWTWLSVAAAAPVTGAGLGALLTIPPRAVPFITAVLAGLLVAIAWTLVRPVLVRSAGPGRWALLLAGAAAMAAATTLAG